MTEGACARAAKPFLCLQHGSCGAKFEVLYLRLFLSHVSECSHLNRRDGVLLLGTVQPTH